MASELVDDKVGDMSAGQDVQLVRTLNDTVNEAKLVIERFRQSQFHFTEADVLILLGLYAILFVVGLAGNVFILTRLCRLNRKLISNKRYSSLFNPFLVNLCASDQLVLLSCCPLMAYSKATSFWHFGPMTCSGVHYVQALSVTSSTLSMAAISLQRFLVVKYPTSSGNKRFHARMNILLLLMVWVISLTTSLPVLFVRKQETITLVKSLDSTFTFCLEHWQSSDLRKAYSALIFLTVYVTPSSILLYCQLSVGYLIREYEKRAKMTTRLSERRSFNRRGFRLRSSDMSTTATNSEWSTTTTMGPTSDSVNGFESTMKKKRQRQLNRKRKSISRLIIWTTVVFVLCWMPYNLVSLWLDVDATDLGLAILPFTLFLGHMHSAVNPFVYWLLNKKKQCTSLNQVELRCEHMRHATMSVYNVPLERETQDTSLTTRPNDLVSQRRMLMQLLGPVRYRTNEIL